MPDHDAMLDFTTPERAEGEPRLIVDLGAYEGPLDLLLDLARRQKVDLKDISILALAEQFLAFIAEARRMRLELAADYLVMAAWLAFLKSRLLLPGKTEAAEPEAVELAAVLAERLRELEAIRRAGQWLAARPQLGVDVFARGATEAVVVQSGMAWDVSLRDLIDAYLDRRRLTAAAHVTIARRIVWSLQEARERLEKLIGRSLDWAPIDAFLAELMLDEAGLRSARASAFAASLELVREGAIDLKQDRPFAPLYARRRVNEVRGAA